MEVVEAVAGAGVVVMAASEYGDSSDGAGSSSSGEKSSSALGRGYGGHKNQGRLIR